jgi:hypothetical protein
MTSSSMVGLSPMISPEVIGHPECFGFKRQVVMAEVNSTLVDIFSPPGQSNDEFQRDLEVIVERWNRPGPR